jgi:restriction endonuclease Mrr
MGKKTGPRKVGFWESYALSSKHGFWGAFLKIKKIERAEKANYAKQIELDKQAKYAQSYPEVHTEERFNPALSPTDLEILVQKLFEKMGYTAKHIGQTGDYGVDVIAEKDGEKVIIQVKKYTSLVTPEEVQRTLGALHHYKADKAVLVTTSGFTTRAKALEQTGPIELWNKKIFQEMLDKYMPRGTL